jgi:hypothetical protein
MNVVLALSSKHPSAHLAILGLAGSGALLISLALQRLALEAPNALSRGNPR